MKNSEDVYGKYIEVNARKLRVGDCITFRRKNLLYCKVLGEIIEIGNDSYNGDYIYVKDSLSRNQVWKHYLVDID